MNSKIELSPAHKRSLSAVARSIEDSLNDITVRLQSSNINTKLHHVEPSFTDPERALILETVEEIRKDLTHFIEVFDIQPSSVTESQIVQAQCTYLSSLLQDSYSVKMKRYGKIPIKEAEKLDRCIAHLAKKIEKLREIVSFSEDKL